MNTDKIKQFEKQSWDTQTNSVDCSKFAKLIIDECVMFIDVGASKFSDDTWIRLSVTDIGAMIKEHFGVNDE